MCSCCCCCTGGTFALKTADCCSSKMTQWEQWEWTKTMKGWSIQLNNDLKRPVMFWGGTADSGDLHFLQVHDYEGIFTLSHCFHKLIIATLNQLKVNAAHRQQYGVILVISGVNHTHWTRHILKKRILHHIPANIFFLCRLASPLQQTMWPSSDAHENRWDAVFVAVLTVF